MANPFLPNEILIEIFSRLPSKSIGKCKCLSKYWLSFLSTPLFINLCLANNGKLILITPSHSLYLVTPKIDSNAVSRKIELPGSWTQVVGSCKGLVLLKNKEGGLYLVNPLTSIVVKIPNLALTLEKNESTRIHGFGYDSSSHDYKIVTISVVYISSISEYKIQFVDVYSVKRGVRKMVHFPYDDFVPVFDQNLSGVFVNGAIHWQRFSNDSRLIAFDLANEYFYEITTPILINSFWEKLVVRGGRLCIVPRMVTIMLSPSDVWTMEEYGSVESWKKFTINENESWDGLGPLCFAGEDLLVLATCNGRLAIYDVKEEVTKEFVIDGVPNYCKDKEDFETLAQPFPVSSTFGENLWPFL